MNFKLGDLIYSQDFRKGTLGIVMKTHDNGEHTIEDCFILDQMWRVRPEYNWRIATDDDIVKHMTDYFRPMKEVAGYSTFDLDEEYLSITAMWDTFHVNFEDAVKLRDYLNKWIVSENLEDILKEYDKEIKEYFATKESTDESETDGWY